MDIIRVIIFTQHNAPAAAVMFTQNKHDELGTIYKHFIGLKKLSWLLQANSCILIVTSLHYIWSVHNACHALLHSPHHHMRWKWINTENRYFSKLPRDSSPLNQQRGCRGEEKTYIWITNFNVYLCTA